MYPVNPTLLDERPGGKMYSPSVYDESVKYLTGEAFLPIYICNQMDGAWTMALLHGFYITCWN